MSLTRNDIEKQLEIERAILDELTSGRYEDRRESYRYVDEEGHFQMYDEASRYPIFPDWRDAIQLRISALELMLESMDTGHRDPALASPERHL